MANRWVALAIVFVTRTSMGVQFQAVAAAAPLMIIGPPPGPVMALLPRALPPERLTTGFSVFYTVFYLMMALTQPVAGLVRDRAGDPAAPIVFAAAVMAATVLGLAVFRRVEC